MLRSHIFQITLYNIIEKILKDRLNDFVIEKDTFEYKLTKGKPSKFIWLNLYASAIRLTLEQGCKEIICGALSGDGQKEELFHNTFKKFSLEIYGININTPFIGSDSNKSKVLKTMLRLLNSHSGDANVASLKEVLSEKYDFSTFETEVQNIT